ncbi:MAG: thymidylate synthase [bacterium]|nr:thymidylate synthase [bacterium]MDZ4285409.1 thymidylate synthase [Candidatus Sungbacteria bacterium]
MRQYLDALQYILDNGEDVANRTGIDSRAVFGMQMRYNMADGFPAMTTKKLAFKGVKAELLWFLKGSGDVKVLQGLGSKIWDANAEAPYWKPKAKFDGDLGRVYGVQWRSWQKPDGTTMDQLVDAINLVKNDSDSRRIIVSAWNPGELDQMALPPCHSFFQLRVINGKLSLQMYQRSCDMFLGVPFNIASYSLLLHMLAQVTGLKAHEFIHTLGDAHIYHNHFDQVREQMSRSVYALPTLWLNTQVTHIDGFTMDDIKLVGYQSHESIKADMAV